VLVDDKGRKWLVPIESGMVNVPRLGVVDSEKVLKAVGGVLRIGGEAFLVLRPSSLDLLQTIERKAQIITAKDIAVLLFYSDVKPGDTVVEAGSGSGALTIALARAVGDAGRVISYDVREDFLAVARRNVEAAGVSSRVVFRHGDVRMGIDNPADAVLLDLPDPWNAVKAVHDALRPGGHLASYSPNMEQVKEMVLAMERAPFFEVRTVELLEREMEVREQGVRPAFAALGHTGYLTVGRKVNERP